ncbi:MAG: GAF domain-containing protein, partial [Chloroflexi bacterium]|nr:GAF domain-containing protein [Chloroflexota bacterium]
MGFLSKMSLQQSFTIRVAAAVIVIFAFIAYLAIQAMAQSTDLIYEERVTLAQTVARHVELVVGDAFDQLERMAGSSEVDFADSDLTGEKQLLRTFKMGSGTFSSLTLVDSNGTVLWTEPYMGDLVGKNVGSTSHVHEALQSGTPGASEAADVKGTGQPVVSLAVPIHKGSSQIVGALIGDLEVSSANIGIVSALNIGPTSYAEILNEKGVVIASTRYDQILRRSSHADLIEPMVKAGKPGVQTHYIPGDETDGAHLVAVAPVRLVPWVAVIEQDKDVAFLLPQQLQQRMLLGGLGTLLIVSLLFWLSIRNLVQPIKMLTSASEKIASGDLSVAVASKRQDEIGILARSFEAMRTKLKGSLEEVERWNRELQGRVHHRTKELSALVEASKALTSTHDLDDLFGLIMAQTRDILRQADAGVLRLYDPDLDRLVAASSFGFSQESLSRAHLKPGEGFSGKVFRFGKPILCQRVEEMAEARKDISVENRYILEQASSSLPEFQSVVGVPLVSKNVTLGSLVLYSFQSPEAFADSDLELLRAFADQIAIAIENTRLIRETQERASQIMVINEITKAINSSLDFHQVFHTIASETKRFIGFDVACIALLDEQNQELQVFELGVNGSVKLATEYDLSSLESQEDWLLDFHRAILARETLIAKNLHEAGKAPEEAIFLAEGVKSVIRLPLISGHDVFGAFSLGSKEPTKYSRRDLQALEQIAAEIAIAVRNAHLFSQSVTQSLNLEATINVLTDGLMTVGRNLRILSLNPSGEKLLGWSSDELRGKECAVIIEALDEDGKNICRDACLNAQILAGAGRDGVQVRVYIKRRNGDRVPCVINTGVARNSQGEITHFIHTFRDISEEVKRQKEIQQ